MTKKLSVIIPSKNEQFLPQTVADLFAKAAGPIEIIVVLDGYWPNPPLPDRKGLIQVHRGEGRGMRDANNTASQLATGDFIMKCDAHCLFDTGFDEILKRDCEDDMLMVPRRYSLDAEKWERGNIGKMPIDYHYLSCPIWSLKVKDDYSMHGIEWRDRTRERWAKPEYEIDEEMSFQGSLWFMSRKLWGRIYPMDTLNYGMFAQEPQEIGNKVWLGGGRIVVNKRTWYAHLHKGKRYGRGYHISPKEIAKGHEYSAKYWMNNLWPERVHDLEWLINRFWPVPDWPENWKEIHASGFGPNSIPEKSADGRKDYRYLGQG